MKKFILVFTMLSSFTAAAQTFSFGDGAADMVSAGTEVKYQICDSFTNTANCQTVASRPMDPSCQQIFPLAAHGEQEFFQNFYCPSTSLSNPKCKYGFEVACGDGRYQWAANPWYRQMSQFQGQQGMWGQPPMMYPWMNNNYGYNPYMNNGNRQPMPFGYNGTGTTTTGGTTGSPTFSFGT